MLSRLSTIGVAAFLLAGRAAPPPTTDSSAAGTGPGRVVAGQTTIELPDTSAFSTSARRILALEVERSAAIARHDTTWLATLYAPDFQGVPANGQRVDQAALLRIFTGDSPELRFQIDELGVRDFGTTATVMGRLRTTTLGGQTIAESRYLHVYVLRDDHWWIVAAVGSAVQRPAARPAPNKR